MPRPKESTNKKFTKNVKCAVCNKKFEVYKSYEKTKKTSNYFCSRKCHKIWGKNSENNPRWKGGLGFFKCNNCGKLVKRKKHEIAKCKNNYCSPECRIEGRKTLIALKCECCGKEIQKPKAYSERFNHFFCDRSCRAAWMCGPNAPSWNGGTKSLKYCNAWSDKEYKEELKERDGNQCLNPYCFKDSSLLVLHHIDYDKKNCNPNNLITVCSICNNRANTNRKWHTDWYRSIMYRRYGYIYEKAA